MAIQSKISGVGSYVPPNKWTNFDLEDMMDTTDEWIQQRTGIVQRYWVDEKTSTSDLAVCACKKAIEDAGLENKDIDMIVFATLSPDHDFPGTGCFLQHKLGIPEITVLDIRQQCSGFLYGLSIADKFIQSGTHQNILLVGAEVHSKGLDRSPNGRNVGVLFGDGAGAVVINRADVQDSNQDSHIINSFLYADGEYAKELWIPAPGNALGEKRITHEMLHEGRQYPYMNGRNVFIHATKRMAECLQKSLSEACVEIEDVDIFLFHQANLKINSKVAEILGIPREKVFNTIQDYANTTAATIPLGMDRAMKEGKLEEGMLVGSAAFGSGFTWASALWRQ